MSTQTPRPRYARPASSAPRSRQAHVAAVRGGAAHHHAPAFRSRQFEVQPGHSLDLYDVLRHTTSADFGFAVDTHDAQTSDVVRTAGGLLGRGWPPCPNRPVRYHPVTGEVVPNWCMSLLCWSCVVPKTIQASEALAAARPTHWATVTGLQAVWSGFHGIQKTMARFGRRLNSEQRDAAWCYQVEPNPLETGAHAHVWLRDVDVDSGVLSMAVESARAGLHVVYGEAYTRYEFFTRPVITYGFKTILEARPNDYDDWWPEATEYLALNGGRLTHQSRTFWLDATGGSCTKAEAVRAARSLTCSASGGRAR